MEAAEQIQARAEEGSKDPEWRATFCKAAHARIRERRAEGLLAPQPKNRALPSTPWGKGWAFADTIDLGGLA